ncbi:hypothetical protein [Microbulbifer sp. M83]|uniref:hypothetical protein n=1 Tax=Microbulbifer sp. M83 TaxID=3118246 RepID=UPI002FE08F91
MPTYISRALACSLLIAASPVLVAQAGEDAPGLEIHKFGGLEMGYGTYAFPEKLDQTIVFPVANLTGGLAYQRFNLALNISGSVEDAEVSEEDFIGDASRQDLDITFGYQASDLLSLFIGYKSGETNLDLFVRDSATRATDYEYYRQSGPFAGINIGKSFANAGKLDFSVAYASLDADNRFFGDGDGVEAGEMLEFDDIYGKTSGSSSGYSINLGWTIPMSGNLLFRSKLRYNSYRQDIRFGTARFGNVSEQSTMLLAGIIGVF